MKIKDLMNLVLLLSKSLNYRFNIFYVKMLGFIVLVINLFVFFLK